MADDFAQCLVSNSRMAARAITRRYDAYLRPSGMTATRFSLLAAIKLAPERTVSELAESRGFDRTTLTRNLDRLERDGFITCRPAEKGNGRLCKTTRKGDAMIDQLLPQWRRAQAELRHELGDAAFDQTLAALKLLSRT
jgi:DNA-binding MarR family transcriptional regulator